MPSPYGHFGDDCSYTISDPRPPRPWFNYLWNRQYVCLVGQNGQGYSFIQDDMGRRVPLVESRICMLRDRDTGRSWSAFGLGAGIDAFSCEHRRASTVISCEAQGIRSRLEILVALNGGGEIWRLRIENLGDASRTIDSFSICCTEFDGSPKPQSFYMCNAAFHEEQRCLCLDQHGEFGTSEDIAIGIASSLPATSWDSRFDSVIGYGGNHQPDCLQDDTLGRCCVAMEKAVLALQHQHELAAGASVSYDLLLAAGSSRGEILALAGAIGDRDQVDTLLTEAEAFASEECGATTFSMPDAEASNFCSTWLKRQITLGTLWARVRHNGYRDLTQDIGALAHMNPQLAEERLARILSYQYSSGYAPRTWLNGQIRDNDFADNHVWISFSAHALLMETGDASTFDKRVPFNDGSAASLYEHVKRSVDFLWQDRSQHGLVRFRSGDWNDAMNAVGPKGLGVSVWLSQAFCYACGCLADIARACGHEDDARIAEERAAIMRGIIEERCWDGAWYVRGWDDQGRIIGSSSNEQARLFLNTQSWAVLAGLGRDDGRREQAMDSVSEHLECELGTRTVLDTFDHWRPDIGYMSLKPVGAGENGGVYLHASCFKLLADCQLKRHEAVTMALHKILPMDQTYFAKNFEPYVFCNCYFATDDYRRGSVGQSWGTGTAGWFYTVLLNAVYGLKPELAGLRLDPCLPSGWPEASVHRAFRGASYDIHYDCSAGHQQIASITINGEAFNGQHLPCKAGTHYDLRVVMK